MDPTNRDRPPDRPGGTVHPLRRHLEQAPRAGIAFREPEPDEDEFAGYTMGAAAGPAVDESLEEYESFGFAEDQPPTPARGPRGHEAAAPQGAAPREIPQPPPEPSPAPARAHRRGPAERHDKPAVHDARASENNQQPERPPAGTASHSHRRRRRAALGGLTAAVVVVVLAAVGVSASTGGHRTPRRVADKAALASRSNTQTPLLAPVAAKLARGYAIVVFAARTVGVKVELLAARRRRELALKRRRAAQAAAAAAAAQTARAQAAAAAQTSPVVSDSSGASGGASASSYQPPATSTGSSQSSSGAATSSGSSASASSGSGSSGSATTTSTPTKAGQPICWPGTLGCWPGGPATK